MTGRSGGAAMSWFTGAVDTRVSVVSPIMGISTYAANLPANTQALHCDCMFPINFYMQDMMHQAALIAPRPLLFGEGKKDALFPVPGYLEVKDKVGSLYRGYGRPEEFDLVEVDTAHQDSDFLRERVIHWFDKYLMDIPERKLDMAYTNTPDEQLAVFGGKPPADARNGRVWETFTTRSPSAEFKSLDAWKQRRAELLPNMQQKVFRAMPPELRNLRLERVGAFGRYAEMRLASDETVPVRALLRTPAKQAAKSPALLYVASDGEDAAYLDQLFRGIDVPDSFLRMVVFPRGIGEVPWDKTFWKATLRNAMQVGETVDSMRLADVRAAIESLQARDDVDAARVAVAVAHLRRSGTVCGNLQRTSGACVAYRSAGHACGRSDLPECSAVHRPARSSGVIRSAAVDVLWAYAAGVRVYETRLAFIRESGGRGVVGQDQMVMASASCCVREPTGRDQRSNS